jgi:amino acid transporter
MIDYMVPYKVFHVSLLVYRRKFCRVNFKSAWLEGPRRKSESEIRNYGMNFGGSVDWLCVILVENRIEIYTVWFISSANWGTLYFGVLYLYAIHSKYKPERYNRLWPWSTGTSLDKNLYLPRSRKLTVSRTFTLWLKKKKVQPTLGFNDVPVSSFVQSLLV